MPDFIQAQPQPYYSDLESPTPIRLGQGAQSALGIGALPSPLDLGKSGQNAPALLQKKNEAVDAQIRAKELERTAQSKPLTEGIHASQKELQQKLKAGPETEKIPDQIKFTPTDIQQTMGGLLALAALSGLASRQPLTASLNAMAGMIQGVREGDETRFQRSFKEYDQNLKTVLAKNKQYENEFNRIVKSEELSITQKAEELRLLNVQFDRQVAQVAGQKVDYKNMLDLGMKSIRATTDAELKLESMKARAQAAAQASSDRRYAAGLAHQDRQDAIKERGWREYQSADGTVNRVNIATGKHESITGTSGLTRTAGGKGAAGAAAGGGKALTVMQSTMYEDVATGYFRLGELENIYKQTGEIPAGSAFLQSQLHADGLVSVLRNYAVNRSMPENLQQTDALLLGVAFDIASARSGGRGQLSDAKIREVTRQMPLAGDTDETKALKYKIIVNQLEEANRTLPEQYQYDPAKRGPKGGGATAAAKPTPTQADRDYVKANPNTAADFKAHFGVKP